MLEGAEASHAAWADLAPPRHVQLVTYLGWLAAWSCMAAWLAWPASIARSKRNPQRCCWLACRPARAAQPHMGTRAIERFFGQARYGSWGKKSRQYVYR